MKNRETGATVEAGFTRSPVRLGRNDLNDLSIDEGYVSQWHGVIRFDEGSTTYLDVGSTNGTELNGALIDKNVEVDVTPEAKLGIGPLELRCTRIALRDDQVLSRRAAAFELGGTRRQVKKHAAGGTAVLGPDASPDDLARTIAATMGISDRHQLLLLAQRQRALMDEIKPAYEAFEAAQEKLQAVITTGLDRAAGPERASQASLLAETFPKAFEAPKMAEAAGVAPRGGDLPELFERLAPGSSATWDFASLTPLERLGAVLETLARALIELEHGQDQIRKELSVDGSAEAFDLPRFETSQELLAYLLDGRMDGRDRLDQLSRAFADLALHQLGIIAGTTDGARAALQAISPQGIGAVARGALAKTSFGFGDVLWPFSAAGHYYRYVAKHLDLSTGDRVAQHLFGHQFARAYYRVMGRRR